jgi:hypothetical protein
MDTASIYVFVILVDRRCIWMEIECGYERGMGAGKKQGVTTGHHETTLLHLYVAVMIVY